MTLVQFGAVLLVVAAYGVVHAEVSVDCGWNETVQVKWTERHRVTGSSVLLGHCVSGTTSAGKGGATETVFGVRLDDCGFRRMISGDEITYSNELRYISEAGRTETFPVSCVYPRPQDWAPPLYVPVWRMDGSAGLLFHMAIMNSDFSGPALSSTFYLGSLIPILAAVDQQAHLPLLLLLDECVATTSPELDPSGPVYPIITNGGCLMDSKFSGSRFRPRVRTSELQLLLQAFKFTLGTNIYMHCKISVWDPQSLEEGKKACNYNKEEGRWELLDDPSQSSRCSCCDSHCTHRKGRGLRGLTRNTVLGPLVIKDSPETGGSSVKSVRTARF